MTRILLVEDEVSIRDSVEYALRAEGYDVDFASTGEEALAAIDDAQPDAVILDVMLPGVSGIEVARRLRQHSGVPILMLTAKTAEVDIVLGLESGADDYVQKPFSMPELISRVRALLRRRTLDRRDGETIRRVGGLELELARHTATVEGRAVQLTSSELKLLALMSERPERAYSRRELMQHLWDSDYVGDQRACDAHITNLRRKLEDDPERPRRIVTVRGVGYRLQAV